MIKANLTTKRYALLSAAIVLAFLSSCNNNRNSSRATPVSGYYGANNNGYINGVSQTCTDASQRIGAIYTQSSTQLTSGYSQSLEMNVKSFVTASMSPNDIGSISSGDRDATGVRIEGSIRIDGSRNVIVDQSRISIKIYDSYVGQYDSSGKQITPYEIYFERASAGQMDVNGNLRVSFRDNYGEVIFEGQLSQTQWAGTVTYANSVSYDGSAPSRGTLGQFYIARCGIGL